MKKFIFCLITWLTAFTQPLYATTDLMQVFQQALHADPTLQQAKAKEHNIQENVPIQRAGLLPSLDATADYNKQSETALSGLSSSAATLSLTLSQSILDLSQWFNLKQANYNTKAAAMTYGAALQDLMTRTVSAYFNVVNAKTQVVANQINRQALYRLWQNNKTRFKAGLVKTADVDNAYAAYEASLSPLITAENNLITKQAALTAITGQSISELKELKKSLPLVSPQPRRLSNWLASVGKKNLTVLADQYTLQADQANIHANSANHFPTLTATANYQNSTGNDINTPEGESGNVDMKLSFPIFQGGKIIAQTRQAADLYGQDQAQLTMDYRSNVANTKTDFAGVTNSIAALRADQATLSAYQQALKSTEIAYRAGLKVVNISTVIYAIQNLSNAEINYANDRLNYIVAFVNLKKDVGTLSVLDLQQINQWLSG